MATQSAFLLERLADVNRILYLLPDALEALTGQRQMDASAMAEYFEPLKKWLDEQNRGATVGW